MTNSSIRGENRPNIIFIMTDQQRWDTIRAWGHNHAITPNLDRLARHGVSFQNAFCAASMCVASRTALFTGMYPHNTGVYSFFDWADHRNWVQDLNESGYYCASMGKMHFMPRDVPGGFHERVIVENPTNDHLMRGGPDDHWGRYLRLHGVKRPYDRHISDPDWLKKFQCTPWKHDEHLQSDVFIGRSAVSWVEDYAGQTPFFLQVGFTGPHEPWSPLPRHLEMVADVPMPEPIPAEGDLMGKPPQHEWRKQKLAAITGKGHESVINMPQATASDIANMRRHYMACITTIDERIGEILDALEQKGHLENSVIIFTSDHGEMLGDHGLAYKWLMYDQVVHVPLMVCDFRKPAQGETRKELVSLIDVAPTIANLAGLPAPDYFDGASLLPYLQNRTQKAPERQYVFCEEDYMCMMRSLDWKLVYYQGQEDGELYCLAEDPEEAQNLWNETQYAEQKNRLLRDLLDWHMGTNYFNAGYRYGRRKHYKLRLPFRNEEGLQGRSFVEKRPFLQ